MSQHQAARAAKAPASHCHPPRIMSRHSRLQRPIRRSCWRERCASLNSRWSCWSAWLVYASYVVPIDGFEWHYLGAILAVAVLAMLAFQAADIYQVQAFRGYEKQYFRLASAWSVVFLLTIGVTFFAKSGDEFSRVWLAGFYVIGLVTLVAFRRALFLMVRQWTRAGRLDRRTVIVGAERTATR